MTLNPPKPATNGQVYTDSASGRSWQFDSSVGTEGVWRSIPAVPGSLPAGSIIQWAGSTAPANWLFADGAAVSRTTYASLFAAIGTTYGAGDGSTTFNVPDLRGRVAVGKNSGTFGTLGATGGAETHALTGMQIPPIPVNNMAGTAGNGDNFVYGTGGSLGGWGIGLGANNVGTSLVWASAAEDNNINRTATPHNNLQPYIVTNYIIKATSGWSAGDSELATRVGALEVANATTNKAGLVPIIPASVSLGSGTGSVDATGLVTFTGATIVSLNTCFSSAFLNYLLVWDMTAGSADNSLFAQFRTGGTTDVTGYSAGYHEASNGGAIVSSGGTSQTSVKTGRNSAAGGGAGVMEIFAPYDSSQYSRVIGRSTDMSFVGWGAGYYATKKSHDGFTINSTTTATFTGTLRVYGYRN